MISLVTHTQKKTEPASQLENALSQSRKQADAWTLEICGSERAALLRTYGDLIKYDALL